MCLSILECLSINSSIKNPQSAWVFFSVVCICVICCAIFNYKTALKMSSFLSHRQRQQRRSEWKSHHCGVENCDLKCYFYSTHRRYSTRIKVLWVKAKCSKFTCKLTMNIRCLWKLSLAQRVHKVLWVIFSTQTEPMSGQCLIMSAQYSIHNS